MPFNHNIPDIAHYNTEMQKSMIDKIYFMDKVDATVFVDVGCADGTLISYLKTFFPDATYIGFDISKEMIAIAKEKVPGAFFTTDWDEVKAIAGNQKTCGILSSIIHEVYSYLREDELKEFWSRIWSFGFDYIAIRDMMVSSTTSRPADPITVSRIKQLQPYRKIAEWEEQWGSISENWSLVHFLLTYRYEKNWVRELKENYLPISVEKFLNTIPKEYKTTLIEHYTLPFIRNKVEEDFGIQLQDRTHIKLILKK